VIERVGIIGVGELAGYVVEGLLNAVPGLEIVLSPRNEAVSADLAQRFGVTVAAHNQAVADSADLILVATRPPDVLAACESVEFRADHNVVSTAAGVPMASLEPAVAPASVVRAMPITCSAINRSPTLLYPDRPRVRALFDLLGNVHVVDDEAQFTAASTITAFYGWVYALLDETVVWTVREGVPLSTARALVLETARGAAEMGLANPERGLSGLLDSLATPGGVTREGLRILAEQGSLAAWVDALDAVHHRMRGDS